MLESVGASPHTLAIVHVCCAVLGICAEDVGPGTLRRGVATPEMCAFTSVFTAAQPPTQPFAP